MLYQSSRLFARSFVPIAEKAMKNNRNLSLLRTAKFQVLPKSAASTLGRFQYRSLAAIPVKLESLGDSISTAVVVEWKKNAGDGVKADDVIAVVETDKVTMDIRAKTEGVFVKGFGEVGAEVTVGNDFYVIDSTASASSSPTPSVPAPPVPASPAPVPALSTPTAAPTENKATASVGKIVDVPVPRMGESISQGVLATWAVEVGSFVKAGDVIASVETDKVTIDIQAPAGGKVVKLYCKQGDEVHVDQPLFVLEEGAVAAPSAASTKAVVTPSVPVTPAAPAASTPATPKKAEKPAAPAASTSTPAAPTPSKTVTGDRSESRVKMTRMRQRIAERLKSAQNTAAMLTTFQEVDMSLLMDLRNKYKDDFEKKHGVKLGFMSAFVKASSAALMEIPAINARIDDTTKEIVYHNYTDISVAVASPSGLVVPVLRNCEKMSFADVEKTIGMYGKKAKEGSLAIEDMVGGTFTISNGGVFGSLFGTPIINPPQSAILGMHATKMRAVVVNGKVEARPMMYLALTYDHRLIDGREAVTFLKSLQGKIEDPSKLLLEL